MNIYEVSSRFQQLLDQDEYTPMELEELDLLYGSVQDKLIEMAKYIKNMEAERAAINEARLSMEERAIALQDKIAKQTDRLKEYMEKCNLKIVKSPLFDIKYSVNRPTTDIFDETIIPAAFVSFEQKEPVKKISKDGIRQAIESGEEVPGARLIYKTKVEIK
jgi:hypothetical protein